MKTQYAGADLEMPKLNKKQREYLTHLLWDYETINTFADIKDNYAIGLALMILDGKGWLIDDYAEAVEQFIKDYREAEAK
jgi:hypothetical protein